MSQAIYYVHHKSLVPEQAIDIPVDKVFNKATILPALAKACDFPSYFSHNWDSAWDCLTDSDVTQLQLYLDDTKEINYDDLESFKSLIVDAYRDFGKPQLWIVISAENHSLISAIDPENLNSK